MTYPDVLSIAVTIDGTNVEDEIYDGEISYSDILTARANSWSFTLIDPDTAPNDWDEVIIYDGATKILAGYIIEITQSRMDGNSSKSILYTCHCGSYAARMSRHIIKEEYDDKTDAYIINDILTNYANDINGTTYVNELKTYNKKRFNRKSIHFVLEQLARDAGAQWHIDADKNLHFFLNEENLSPFDISDNPDLTDTFPASDIEKSSDGSGVVNRIEVVGGNYLSSDQTDYYQGTGESNKIQLDFKYSAPDGESAVQMWRNDGTAGTPSWTALTVNVGHIDTIGGANEVLFYYQEQLVESQSEWPNLVNALKVTGRYEIPLRYRKRNQASYDHYGQWFDDVIIDTNITSKEDASIAASAQLASNALATTLITLNVREHGLKAGQTIHIENTDLGIDDDYLIHRIDAEITVGGYAQYSVEVGAYNKDLADYLIMLLRSSDDEVVWRDDEVLDEVFDEYESLTLLEVTNSTIGATTAPYTWGNFEWGFAKWST